MPPNRKFFGCVTRKERWGLSARGWLTGIIVLLVMAGVWMMSIYPFLAQNRRENTKVLVVEGWVREYAIRAAVTEFQTGHYDKVYATGGPIAGSGGYSNDYNTVASVGAELLVKDGLPSD
ncbi:MAG TPA: YdcF family protein, partial [Verrucomicrobiae bacterium]|nr:YdcF family protein [Verrucomicrobiae bacterium]